MPCWTNRKPNPPATVILEPVDIKPDQLESFLPCSLKLEPWEKEGEIVRGEVKSQQMCATYCMEESESGTQRKGEPKGEGVLINI